jgi:hypothetical protein
MGFFDAEAVKHSHRVRYGFVLSVVLVALRHVRGRVSPRAISDAAIVPTERRDLSGPGAVITGEFVNEQDRIPGSVILVKKRYAVGTGKGGQSRTPDARFAQA